MNPIDDIVIFSPLIGNLFIDSQLPTGFTGIPIAQLTQLRSVGEFQFITADMDHGSADYGADYRRAVSECIFGCGLKEDPFLAIGDIIPPREKGKNCFLPVESIDVEQLNRCKRDMAMQTSKRFWADNRSAWLELLGNIESEINSSKG